MVRNRYQALSVVWIAPRSVLSLNVSLPMKLMPADAGARALVDLEHEVDAVLVELDDLGLDPGGVAAVAAVELEDAADGVLDPGAGVDDARPELDLVGQDVVVEPLVALERDPVDDRVLDHLDHQHVALPVERDVVEQAGLEQVAAATRRACPRRTARPGGR